MRSPSIPRPAGATLVAALTTALCLVLSLAAAASARPAPLMATGHHHRARRHHRRSRHHAAARCPRGRVRTTAHGHRHCVKAPVSPVPSAASPALPALRAQLLRLTTNLRTKRGRLRLKLPKQVTRALGPVEAAAVQLAAPAATAARHRPSAHAALDPSVLDRQPASGTPTDTLEQQGWKVETHPDPEAPSVTASRKGTSVTMRVDFDAKAGDCPNAKGEDDASSPIIFDLDLEAPVTPGDRWPEHLSGTPATAFFHFASDMRAKATSRDADDAKLVDFDLRGRYSLNIQAGLKDATGKVLLTNEPTLATVTLDATHVKPAPESATEAWIRSMFARTSWHAVFTHIDQALALRSTGFAWGLSALGASREYQRVEEQHWQKDCLDVAAAFGKDAAAPSEHVPMTVTGITARGGQLAVPVTLKLEPDGGAVTPTSATFSGTPIAADYTAPASDWLTAGVKITATSKMGVGQRTVTIPEKPTQQRVRFVSEATETFAGGNEGTGSGSWAVGADVPLSEASGDNATGPIPPKGSGPLAFSAFSYARHAIPALCQGGEYGSEDIDGTGTDPGTFTVDSLWPGDSGVDQDLIFEVAPPAEHYHQNFNNTGTACESFANDSTIKWWGAAFNGLSYSGLSGVTVESTASAMRYHVTSGWQPGTGEVLAYRDLSYTANPNGLSDPMHVHVRIEVLAHR